MTDILESRRFGKTSFDMSMILFNQVIKVLNRTMCCMHIKAIIFQFFERTKQCRSLICCKNRWFSKLFRQPFYKGICCLMISCFSKLKIKCISITINRTIQIRPLPFHFDVRLIYMASPYMPINLRIFTTPKYQKTLFFLT